jgi:hypothetical protein
VQTAYLKAHYPVDYMAAQLLVERDKTEKVVNFVSNAGGWASTCCPPTSIIRGWTLTSRIRPADTPQQAQRDPSLAYPFPVPERRAANPFRDGCESRMLARARSRPFWLRAAGGLQEPGRFLPEYASTCARSTNRTLECLIKAGAFDRFGRRSQLLAR